jgi:hypothetical protein
MKKKVLLLLVLVIPSAIAFLMEYSKVNFKKLPFYGPKANISLGGKDSNHYSLFQVKDSLLNIYPYLKDTNQYPILIFAQFLPERKSDLFNAGALIDAIKYRYEKLSLLEVFINYDNKDQGWMDKEIEKYQSIYKNIHLHATQSDNYKRLLDQSLFLEKPYYIDYNFLILLDKKRRIRGYYDPRYASEMKRMYEEFKHLKIHDEARDTRKENRLQKQ